MKTFETYLPIFPGFYGTLFDTDNEESEIDDINSHRRDKGLDEISYDDCVWNYTERNEVVAKDCTDSVAYMLRQLLGGGIDFKFQKLVSPREYNFSNDSVNIEVEMTDEILDNIKQYLSENLPEFTEYLIERYTSCSGFISHHSTNPMEWLLILNSEDNLEHKLGSILNFILLNEEYDHMALLEDVISQGSFEIYAENYNELIGE